MFTYLYYSMDCLDSENKTNSNQTKNKTSFQCDVCEKVFGTSYHLKRHKIIHSNDKPHSCHVCQKSFGRKDKLTQHTRTHQDDHR